MEPFRAETRPVGCISDSYVCAAQNVIYSKVLIVFLHAGCTRESKPRASPCSGRYEVDMTVDKTASQSFNGVVMWLMYKCEYRVR